MIPFALPLVILIFVVLKLTVRTLTFSNMSIFLGVWIALLGLYQLKLVPFDPLSLELQLYLTTFFGLYGFSYFTGSTAFGYARTPRSHLIKKLSIQSSNRAFMYLFLILWLALIIVFVRSVSINGLIMIVSQGGARKAITNLENVKISFYLFGYLFLIAASVSALPKSFIRRVLFFTIIGIVLGSMLVTAAKINFVSASFLIYIVWYNNRHRSIITLLRHFGLAIIALYAFIFIFSLYTGKVIDKSIGSISSIQDILQFSSDAFLYPYEYFVGSLAALNKVFLYAEPHTYLPGSISFYSVYQILMRLGMIDSGAQLAPQFYDFVTVGGVTTNVYTFLYDLFLDFGLFFPLIAALFLGFIHSRLDVTEQRGGLPELIYLSQVSKLSAFLSFVNFRYGDTIFILALGIWAAVTIIRSLTSKSRHVRERTF